MDGISTNLHSKTIDHDLKCYTHCEAYRCHTGYSFSGNFKPKKEKLNFRLGSFTAFDLASDGSSQSTKSRLPSSTPLSYFFKIVFRMKSVFFIIPICKPLGRSSSSA